MRSCFTRVISHGGLCGLRVGASMGRENVCALARSRLWCWVGDAQVRINVIIINSAEGGNS